MIALAHCITGRHMPVHLIPHLANSDVNDLHGNILSYIILTLVYKYDNPDSIQS